MFNLIGRFEDGKVEGRKEGMEIGLEIGVERERKVGREEGENNKAIEIAQNLKNLGLDVEHIMQATGLSAKEIDDL